MAVNKIITSFEAAVADIPDGAIIMMGNFAGPGGIPYYLIHALRKQGAKNLGSALVSLSALVVRSIQKARRMAG